MYKWIKNFFILLRLRAGRIKKLEQKNKILKEEIKKLKETISYLEDSTGPLCNEDYVEEMLLT